MSNNVLDGLSLVDSTGRLILATTVGTLLLGIGANLFLRARYGRLEADLEENAVPRGRFSNEVLNAIARSAERAASCAPEPNTQAIVEDHFQSDLRPLLLAERFVRAATGLVIILGLLGTFYGLTSSIGRLVGLVAGEPGAVTDVTQGVTSGLTQALSGMAVAFSNSLVGILSAVLLTVLGVFSNPTDRRVALMVRIETYLDRLLSDPSFTRGAATAIARNGLDRMVASFGESVERLEATVGRFDSALQAFSTSTRDFSEFNAHLKDNVQRMSLSFGDLRDALKDEVVARKNGSGR
jgi:methyl-accepting chemotaxis protein